jgi:glutamyl-tRNA synthetase
MKDQVRVRFAPSPTGPLHIGGVRTALFNYLFAKNKGGTFILRIEDTDQTRFVEGAEDYIVESLNWCGIPFDEGPGKDGGFGPYRQSERKALYKDYAQQLIDNGSAYYAFDTPEELDQLRKEAEENKSTFTYNSFNREGLNNSLNLSKEEVEVKLSSDTPFVIRFKTPSNTQISTQDLIRGHVVFNTNTLDDKVLYKSDGMPTYHLANIVDDHLMNISHVIRGEEWLPSLPLHIQLYQAFGWDIPEFAHLPLIMKPVGKGKLSKRDGDKMGFPVFPLAWNDSIGYREEGFEPEAVINFLALLGWNPGDEREVFSLGELVQLFDLSRVNKSGARFDPEKNKWFNGQQLQLKSEGELLEGFKQLLAAHQLSSSYSDQELATIISLVKERAVFAKDLLELSDYFFVAPESYDEKNLKKQWKEQSPEIMKELIELWNSFESFDSASLEEETKKWIEAKAYSFGQVMPPLRLVLVGALKGPHLFDIAALIGKQDSISRIETALKRLS